MEDFYKLFKQFRARTYVNVNGVSTNLQILTNTYQYLQIAIYIPICFNYLHRYLYTQKFPTLSSESIVHSFKQSG